MPRQYCQTCPASPQPSVHTRHVHTQELCMEPVTDAAVVTGAPQPDPLLPRRPSGGPRSTGSSRLSGTSRSRAPLCHTTDLRGPPPRRPFQAAPEEGLSQLLPPPGTAEESPSVRRALSEMPLGNSHGGRASPMIRRSRIPGPGLPSLWSGVRVFPEKRPDSRIILGMEAES